MAVLFDPEGPFKRCSVTKGHGDRLEALPLSEPPAELFSD